MRTRLPALALIALALLGAATASAQNDPFARNIDLVPFKPTPLGESGIMLEGGQLPKAGTLLAGDGPSVLGERPVVVAPRAVFDVPLGRVKLLANLGMRIRGPGRFLNLLVWHEYVAGLGVQVAIPDFWILREVLFTAETQLAT